MSKHSRVCRGKFAVLANDAREFGLCSCQRLGLECVATRAVQHQIRTGEKSEALTRTSHQGVRKLHSFCASLETRCAVHPVWIRTLPPAFAENFLRIVAWSKRVLSQIIRTNKSIHHVHVADSR